MEFKVKLGRLVSRGSDGIEGIEKLGFKSVDVCFLECFIVIGYIGVLFLFFNVFVFNGFSFKKNFS